LLQVNIRTLETSIEGSLRPNGSTISPADSMTDVLTADFVGLGAAWDFMAASAGTTDMHAVRTTTITSIAPYSGVSRSFWGDCGMGLHCRNRQFQKFR
jgi:hypothetical protein